MKEDMHEKTNCCTIQNDKLERKQYIKKCKGYTTRCHKNQIKYVEHTMQLQKKWIRQNMPPLHHRAHNGMPRSK